MFIRQKDKEKEIKDISLRSFKLSRPTVRQKNCFTCKQLVRKGQYLEKRKKERGNRISNLTFVKRHATQC